VASPVDGTPPLTLGVHTDGRDGADKGPGPAIGPPPRVAAATAAAGILCMPVLAAAALAATPAAIATLPVADVR
jgi:hypothetical protein